VGSPGGRYRGSPRRCGCELAPLSPSGLDAAQDLSCPRMSLSRLEFCIARQLSFCWLDAEVTVPTPRSASHRVRRSPVGQPSTPTHDSWTPRPHTLRQRSESPNRETRPSGRCSVSAISVCVRIEPARVPAHPPGIRINRHWADACPSRFTDGCSKPFRPGSSH
jgi:hypothetical protein